MKTLRLIFSLVFVSSLMFGITACTPQGAPLDNIEAIIDVRTAEEFAAGHLQGAINIDVESKDFETKIQELEKTGHYYLYCRSGRRSEIAHQKMIDLGFSRVADLGSMEDAAATTGLSIVR